MQINLGMDKGFLIVFFFRESRKDKDTDKLLFCGSGSINASDLMDYAAFMRYAFLEEVQAFNYTTRIRIWDAKR